MVLLFIATTVNYMDRQVLSLTWKDFIAPEFHWTMLDTFESFRFEDLKVTNFEMEGSAIAGIAAHLGHNAGTVCCIIAHRHHKASNPDYKPQVRKLIELCLDKLAE